MGKRTAGHGQPVRAGEVPARRQALAATMPVRNAIQRAGATAQDSPRQGSLPVNVPLMGMIMRNSVILIDHIEQDRERGGRAGHEPAVAQRLLGWPMAVAIMGRPIVATALTLLALPAMYAAWFRAKGAGAGA